MLSDIPTGIVVCPINCRPVLEGLLGSAQHRIAIQTQYILDDRIQQLLLRKDPDVDLQIIVANTDDNDPLQQYWGPDILRRLRQYYNHTKVIIIDDEVMLLGSMNMSATSLDRNREIGVIIRDPQLIGQVQSGFDSDRAANAPQ